MMDGELLGIDEIKELVPFRRPYLMLDRAEISADGKSARAINAVSVNEHFFNGHFPHMAIMPGVLQLETMMQLSYLMTKQKTAYPFLAKAKRVKFRKPVTPGDLLVTEVTIVEQSQSEVSLKATATVKEELVCEAQLVIDLSMNEKGFKPQKFLSEPLLPKGGRNLCVEIEAIKEYLPHRYPFLLVDRVIQEGENEDGRAYMVGLKNVSINEPCFQSMSTSLPYLPNHLQLEISAQVGCVQQFRKLPEGSKKTGIFMSVDDSEFFRPVLPGDQLVVICEELSIKGTFGKCRARIFVGEEQVSRCDFKFVIQDND